MTLGLVAGPLQMLFSLLVMQGLSLTMFRTFLNQAIPRFDPMRFSVNIGNDPSRFTQSTPAPANDPQNLMPYLNILAPMLLQQQMNRQPNLQQMQSTLQSLLTTNNQQSAQPQTHSAHVMTAPGYQQTVYGQPLPMNGHQMPQVIILPQILPQPSTSTGKGSASTNLPVQIEPPQKEQGEMEEYEEPPHITRRMLERPPKTTTTTTRRPKVVNRAHAGGLLVQFVTPKTPTGFRRYIIPPVTAKIIDSEVTTNTEPTDDYFSERSVVNTQTKLATDSVKQTSDTIDIKPIISLENQINRTDSIPTNILEPMTTTQTTTVETQNKKTTELSDKETIIFDKNITNHRLNDTDLSSMTDLVHKEFEEHIKTLSVNQIDSNQSQDMFFDNPKDLSSHPFKRVCYYLLRAKDGNLKIKDIDPYICSHLIVGFASVAPNDLIVPKNRSEDPDKYRELTNLKSINRKLKVMLSVGDGSGATFSKMVSNEKSRDRFVASVLDVCDAFDFDGIDIDWEYPYFRTGSKLDKTNFVLLLKELRKEAVRRFRDDFIISATVGAPLVIAMSSYDIPLIGDSVDFVNLMSYDYNTYRSDRPYTGHHSPLYPRPTEKQYFQTLNAAWSATYWANKGMPLHKIVLGIPTYARTYSLVVPVAQGLDVPVSGPGLGDGKLNYTSVCHFVSSGATREFDIYSQVPFAYKNFDWIAYESEISVALKAQWVVKANMGGVMTFALNFDDTIGECRRDGKKFPLQKAISNLLELSSIKSYRNVDHSLDLI